MSLRGRDQFRPRNLTTVSTRAGTGRAQSSAMPQLVPTTHAGIGRSPMPTAGNNLASAAGAPAPRTPLSTTSTRVNTRRTTNNEPTTVATAGGSYSESPGRTHISNRSTYSFGLARQAERTAGAHNTEMRTMNAQLNRLTRDLNTKIKRYRNDSSESDLLLQRAQRLNERLDVLKGKLRLSFQISGESAPDTLQITLRQMAAVDPDGAPDEFVCPITQCLMVDPVSTCDGQIYDRCAIVEWFANFTEGRKPTSPCTNLPLDTLQLTPRPELGVEIQKFLKEQTGTASKHGQDKVLGTEEPNLRQLPSEMRNDGLGLTTPPLEGDGDEDDDGVEPTSTTVPPPRANGPIWGSSVVPASETDSRILNLLRVDESLPVPSADNPHSRTANVIPNAKAPVAVRGTGLGTQNPRRPAPKATRTQARLEVAIQDVTSGPVRVVDTRSSPLYQTPAAGGRDGFYPSLETTTRTSTVRANRPAASGGGSFSRRGNSAVRPTVVVDEGLIGAPLPLQVAQPLRDLVNRVRANGSTSTSTTGNLNSRQRR